MFKKLQNQIDMIEKRTAQISQENDINRMFELLTYFCLSLNTVETHIKKVEKERDGSADLKGEAYELMKFNEQLLRRSKMDKISSRFEPEELAQKGQTKVALSKSNTIDTWHKRVLSNRGKSPVLSNDQITDVSLHNKRNSMTSLPKKDINKRSSMYSKANTASRVSSK